MVQPLIVSDRNQVGRSRLIDPVLQEACGSDIVVPLTEAVGGAQITRQLRIVRPEFQQHAMRVHLIAIIVSQARVRTMSWIERKVAPPSLRARSAISSVID